jgi:signal transduction histidine kinase/CheY-like chemotaxis protein
MFHQQRCNVTNVCIALWSSVRPPRIPASLFALPFESCLNESAAFPMRLQALQAALDFVDQGFTLYGLDLRLVAWNMSFLRLLGFPPEMAYVGAPFESFIRFNAERGDYGPGEAQRLVDERVRAARAFTPHEFERTRPNGCVLRIRGVPVPGHGFVTLYSDVSAEKSAQHQIREHNALLESRVAERTAELRLSEAKLRLITDSIPALIGYFDARREYRYLNRAYQSWYGLDPANPRAASAKQYLGAATYAGIRPNVLRAMAGEAVTFEYEVTVAGRNVVARTSLIPEIAADGSVAGCFELTFDVTDQKRTQEMLVQAQKMEALGQLTGGLAHDFNNILTVVIGNLNALSDARPGDPAVAEFVEPAVDAARRGAELIKALLSFSRQQPLEAQAVDVGPLVASIGRLVRRSLPESLRLDIDAGAAPLWAWIDSHQLQNALLNLILNARDATQSRGTIRVRASTATLDQTAATRLQVQPGAYIRIEVVDDGSGMDAKTLARVFEPFFTTKKAGLGTGLGMAMVYGFIKQSEGAIGVTSEIGQGTTVTLWLPASEFSSDFAPAALEPPRDASRSAQGLALLVEDDPDVRKVARRFLLELGFTVIEAENGVEATQILEQTPGIVLLLSDVVMPGGVDGRELAAFARERCGVPRVVLMSGHAPELERPIDIAILPKPFTRAQLAALIEAALT